MVQNWLKTEVCIMTGVIIRYDLSQFLAPLFLMNIFREKIGQHDECHCGVKKSVASLQ